jgi:hypothetical protein
MPKRLTLSTYEAADTLACTRLQALALLRAAHVQHERLGGALLWDRRQVLALAAQIRRRAARAAASERP